MQSLERSRDGFLESAEYIVLSEQTTERGRLLVKIFVAAIAAFVLCWVTIAVVDYLFSKLG